MVSSWFSQRFLYVDLPAAPVAEIKLSVHSAQREARYSARSRRTQGAESIRFWIPRVRLAAPRGTTENPEPHPKQWRGVFRVLSWIRGPFGDFLGMVTPAALQGKQQTGCLSDGEKGSRWEVITATGTCLTTNRYGQFWSFAKK